MGPLSERTDTSWISDYRLLLNIDFVEILFITSTGFEPEDPRDIYAGDIGLRSTI